MLTPYFNKVIRLNNKVIWKKGNRKNLIIYIVNLSDSLIMNEIVAINYIGVSGRKLFLIHF